MSGGSDLASADAKVRVAAMAALAASATPPSREEMAALLDCLADERKLVQRRGAECIAALASRGVEVGELLRARLAEGSPRARWGAVYALSLVEGPSPETLDTLLETLGVADGDLRWAAVDLLLRAAERSRALVVERLTEVAEGGTPTASKMALYALRALDARGPRSVAAAERALGAADIELRLAGLSALARLSDDHAAAATRIIRLVADPDERMRRAAAATLGTLDVCPPQALAALYEARSSSDPSLRRAAERSLRLLGKEGA